MFNAVTQIIQPTALTFPVLADVKIPSKDNFQTGWWTTTDGTTYTETDKQVNNKCQVNTDCTTAGQCCANFPDTNNKRCIDATGGGVSTVLLPFKAFTPVCASSGNAAPISAKDDLADEAAAQAAQAITDFEALMLTTAKTEDKYADMDADAKAAFDKKWAADRAKVTAYITKDKDASGYSVLTTEQKTIYDAELLKWMKATYEACNANKLSIAC
jgi:hypothetical protein